VLQAEGPLAVATSASYERGAHIIHPRHGTPTAEVASATVVGRSLADADAFATTLFVMGIGGLYWVDDQPGYGAMVITHDGAVLSTARFDRHRVPLAA
jgi:thiamine biosynthesis lipoprotein